MSERIDKIIQDLQGTCQSLNDACESENCTDDDLTKEELETIDCNIFCCESCSWWCEISEMSETLDQICEDCSG